MPHIPKVLVDGFWIGSQAGMIFPTIPAAFRLGMCLIWALICGLSEARAAASPMAVEASSSASSARIRFFWPDRVVGKASADGEAVVVTFDREVDPRAVRDATKMLPGWLASAEGEGRQLRLVPEPGRRATVNVLPRGVEVSLSGARTPSPAAAARPSSAAPSASPPFQATQVPGPSAARPDPATLMIGAVTVVPRSGGTAAAPAPPPPPPPVDAEAAAQARRLRLTQARLMMETGDAEGAKAELQGLLAEVPDSIEVMSSLASVETQLGGWQRAVGLYDRALGLNPDDPSLVRAKAELLREHGPRVRLDLDHRKVKKADRQIVARASGEALAGTSIVGFAVEGNDLNAPVIRRPGGTIESFDGKRFRGEGYTVVDHDGGGLTRLSLIGGTGIAGAAVRHTRAFGEGTLRVGLIAQDPYWDVVDGLVNEARTDRAQVAYERLLGTSWRVAGRLAAGRYGIKGDTDVAHFIGPAFEVAYTAIPGPPSLTVAYGFDAEYIGSRQTAVDALGLEYPLLSVVSREVHSGTLGFSGSFSPTLRYNLFGGYAYDRLNSAGSFFGVDVAYEPYASFELGLAASRSLTASRGTDATLTRFGGYLLWRF